MRRPHGLTAGLRILTPLALLALLAPLIANEHPLLVRTHAGLEAPAARELPLIGRLLPGRPSPGSPTLEPRAEELWRVSPPIPWSYRQVDLQSVLSPPSARHPLGTDALGRDQAARLLHGTLLSLTLGLAGAGLAMTLAIVVGGLAGFLGGGVDLVLMRLAEVLLCFPTFLLALVTLAFLQPSLPILVLVIGLSRWASLSRYVRAEVLRVRESGYVAGARALGAGPLRLLGGHVLPNALAPVFASAGFSFAGAMLIEAGLSFLGFGVPEPLPSWGSLLSQAVGTGRWWLIVVPGAAITLAVTGAQLLSEGARDAFDPRLQRLHG